MSTASMPRDQLRQAHQFLNGAIDDVTEEQAHWLPGGTANPLVATYAHILFGEDAFVAMRGGRQSLFAAGWQGRTGVGELPPLAEPGATPPLSSTWHDWGRRVHVDSPALRNYGLAVQQASDDYLASLRDSRVPYQVPREDQLRARLGGVPAVIYLIFNEGYEATSGEALLKPELCAEAIRLARLLIELLPDEAEARGLLALMLLHDARRAPRRARPRRRHRLAADRAPLSRARAASGQPDRGPQSRRGGGDGGGPGGWSALARRNRPRTGARRLPHLPCRAGRFADAAAAYRRALNLCQNAVETRFLKRRLAESEARSA